MSTTSASAQSEPTASLADSQVSITKQLGQPKPRSALILYATVTGTSSDLAHELGRLLTRIRFHPVRVSSTSDAHITPELLRSYTLTVFIVSTTGQGDVPASFTTFWKALLRRKLGPTYLHGVKAAVFGCGDSSYVKFNWAARKVWKRLGQLGVEELYPYGEGDERHPEGIDGTFIAWAVDLRRSLLELYPLPEGTEPIADDVFIAPPWKLVKDDLSSSETNSDVEETTSNGVIEHDHRQIPGTFTVTLTQNERVTPESHWQDVRHLKLTSSESRQYGPGDVLAIHPRNFSADVNKLIDLQGWTEIVDQPLLFEPTTSIPNPRTYPPCPVPFLKSSLESSSPSPQQHFTLRALLESYVDITAIPRRSFFSHIAHFTTDPMHKERLLEFTKPELVDEFYDYTTRPRRSILEILQEFDTVKIPWEYAGTVFPVLRPRQFSIASGGSLKKTEGGEGTAFELLVAIVKYQTVIRKIREGVCTRYIAALKPGSQLCVSLEKGGLGAAVKDETRPMVLVGPGTGVAPLRAMIYERLATSQQAKSEAAPRTTLFFGGRNSNADFFFHGEWTEIASRMPLEVHTAFSRDQKQKIYVQDLIRGADSTPTTASAENITDIDAVKDRSRQVQLFEDLHVKKGMVFVCGSSGKMPQAVREALVEVYAEQGKMEREEAEAMVVRLEKEGRYVQETW